MGAADTAQIIITVIASFALIMVGKVYEVVQEWFIKTVLKKQTSEQANVLSKAHLVHKILDLQTKKNDNYTSYHRASEIIVSRVVDVTINSYMDIYRSEVLKIEGNLSIQSINEAIHQFNLINQVATYVQIETYMTSIETWMYSEKSSAEWYTLLNMIFNFLVSKTYNIYNNRYTGEASIIKNVINIADSKREYFYSLFSEAMTLIKEKAEEYYESIDTIDKEIYNITQIIIKSSKH